MSSIAMSPVFPPAVAVSSILKLFMLLGIGTLRNVHPGAEKTNVILGAFELNCSKIKVKPL